MTSDLIGCRVSITSRAKIRYEGYLHSVNCETPDEPVLTLSKVRSFGTENRPCDRPVAPREDEYGCVSFRGRDLEDVRLVEASVIVNDDSAIVSAGPAVSSTTDKRSFGHMRGFQNDSFESPAPRLNTSELSPGVPLQPRESSDGGLNPLSNPSSSLFSPSNKIQQPYGIVDQQRRRPGPVGTPPCIDLFQQPSQQSNRSGPRQFGDGRANDAPDLLLLGAFDSTPGSRLQTSTHLQDRSQGSHPPPLMSTRIDAPHDDLTGVFGSGLDNISHFDNQPTFASANNRRYFNRPRGGYGPRGGGGGYHHQQGIGGWGQPRSQHYGGGGGSANHRGRPMTRPQNMQDATLLGEYDYEKANAELAAELQKIVLTSPRSGSEGHQQNDGGSDISSLDNDGGSQVSSSVAMCYDKTKSFFDTISSEQLDKANGVIPSRSSRRDERLLNSDTFGSTAMTRPTYYRRGGGSNYHYTGGAGGGGYRGGGGSFSSSSSNNHYYRRGGYNNNNYNQGFGANHPQQQQHSFGGRRPYNQYQQQFNNNGAGDVVNPRGGGISSANALVQQNHHHQSSASDSPLPVLL